MNFLERSSIMGRKQKLRQERKAAIAAEALQPDKKGGLFWIVLTGLCALMLYPPFFRGLFFSREFLPTHAFSALLFGLWWIYKLSVKKDASFLTHPLDYAVLGLVAAYAISLIPAVNTRAAIGELLKNSNYFIAFWLAAEMTRELKKPSFTNILLATLCWWPSWGWGRSRDHDYPGRYSGRTIHHCSIKYAGYLHDGRLLYIHDAYLNSNINGRFYLHKLYTAPCINIYIFEGAWLAFPVIMVLHCRSSREKGLVRFCLFYAGSHPSCMVGFSSAITAEPVKWLWYCRGRPYHRLAQ